MKYDVVIVGAGPCGIFCAYELVEKNKDLKVLLVDKGHDIYKRRCPVLEHKISKCPQNKEGISGCYPSCSITDGLVEQALIQMVSLTLHLSLVVG